MCFTYIHNLFDNKKKTNIKPRMLLGVKNVSKKRTNELTSK